MAILTFNGESYTVDHAVKGADFIHGYDADSVMIVAFNGITDFSGFTFDGTYMEPEHCLAEGCNDVKFVDGGLKKADGTTLSPADIGAVNKNGDSIGGNLSFVGNDPVFYLHANSAATRFRVYSSKNAVYGDGAGLILQNKEATTNTGVFNLYAADGTKNATLTGTPDGMLTWKGYAIPTYGYGATDLTAGSSALAEGKMHLVYE